LFNTNLCIIFVKEFFESIGGVFGFDRYWLRNKGT